MTAIEIIRRTVTDPAEARYYAALGEAKVRMFLGYPEDRPVDRFAPTVAQIGLLIREADQAAAAAQASVVAAGGVQQESYSEAGVSRSVTYGGAGAAAAARDAYNAVIRSSLQDALARYRRARVVKGGETA